MTVSFIKWKCLYQWFFKIQNILVPDELSELNEEFGQMIEETIQDVYGLEEGEIEFDEDQFCSPSFDEHDGKLIIIFVKTKFYMKNKA